MSTWLTEDDVPWLHVYPQYSHHSSAYLRGSRAGLAALRDALTRALEGGGEADAKAITSDGEGYTVHVQRINIVDLLGPLPYTDEMFVEYRAAFFARNVKDFE